MRRLWVSPALQQQRGLDRGCAACVLRCASYAVVRRKRVTTFRLTHPPFQRPCLPCVVFAVWAVTSAAACWLRARLLAPSSPTALAANCWPPLPPTMSTGAQRVALVSCASPGHRMLLCSALSTLTAVASLQKLCPATRLDSPPSRALPTSPCAAGGSRAR